MIEIQQSYTSTRPVPAEGASEYLRFFAAIATAIIVIGMLVSSIYAVSQALGGSLPSYIVATLFVAILSVFVGALWVDYLPRHR